MVCLLYTSHTHFFLILLFNSIIDTPGTINKKRIAIAILFITWQRPTLPPDVYKRQGLDTLVVHAVNDEY